MMGALPLLPQSTLPNAGSGAMIGATSLTTESGELISFDTLFAQSRAAGAGAEMSPATEGAKAAPAGSFEDLGVILTLLRTSQNSDVKTIPSKPSLEYSPETPVADFAAKNAAPDEAPHNNSKLPVNFQHISHNINDLISEADTLKVAQYNKNVAQQNAPQNDATSGFSGQKSGAAANIARPLIDQMLGQILGQPIAGEGDGSMPSLETIPTDNLSDQIPLSQNETPQPEMPRLAASETPIIPIRMPAPIDVSQKTSDTPAIAQPVAQAAATSVNFVSPEAQNVKAAEKMLPPHLAAMITETAEAPRKPASAPSVPSQMALQMAGGRDTSAHLTPFQRAATVTAPQMAGGRDTSAHLTPLQRAATVTAPQMAPLTVPANVASPLPAPIDANAAMQLMFQQTLAGGPQNAAALEQSAPTAPLSEHILDFTNDDAWIDQIAKDIAATKSAAGEISFRLMPRHLGRLDVTMSQNDQGMSVRVEAQHETAASIFAASQTRLVDELRQQGVRVTSTEITHNSGDAGRQSDSKDHQNQRPDGTHFIETSAERLPDADHSDKGKASPRGRFA
jgi:flagellar hook-length control protein FliK